MQEMYNKIMRIIPNAFHHIPDRFKTQEMWKKAVEVEPWGLKDVLNHFKTKRMCNKAVKHYLFSLQFLPDWFVTQQQLDVWYDDDYGYNDNEMIKFHNGYNARKAQKTKINKNF